MDVAFLFAFCEFSPLFILDQGHRDRVHPMCGVGDSSITSCPGIPQRNQQFAVLPSRKRTWRSKPGKIEVLIEVNVPRQELQVTVLREPLLLLQSSVVSCDHPHQQVGRFCIFQWPD